ncbi:transcriptional repressor TCF25-domain-containing protein [Ilyonectria sp. MPI-CAGE-AT-0026]|nr:transcriptional repressor TCF25-domain-containing protein [Ilyonectria sp. MPI-CAGE-AT-0026]
MSSRQLRKLQKQKELEKTQETAAHNSDESDDDQSPVVARPRASLFAALGGDDDEGHDEEDEAEAEPQPAHEVSEAQPPAGGKSKKKKKKKKKKAKAAQDAADVNDDEEDEIDRAIKELNITTKADPESAAAAMTAQAATRRSNEVLAINPYHLKAVNEMRNLFGRDIIMSAEAEEEQERIRRQREPRQREVDLETFLRGPPNAKKLSEVSLRRNVFIMGREHWPRGTAGGLTMEEVKKAEDGSWTEYAYIHGGDYDAVQAFFFGCVQMGDPMRMVHLLQQVPYHVSTLLQVSRVANQDQNMALAAELCERALFTFGRVTTSAFRQNIEQGRARLDFRRPENRQFWLAGYYYIKTLIRKGTYRTALEWAKLLYTLDPRDPYAMRHFIHPLAIRAHEARWLVDFLDEVEATGDNRDTVYLRQSVVLAKLQLGDTEGARAELTTGMNRVPWLYCALFQELNLDTPPSIWGINAHSDARSFWVTLYIYQAKDLWNNSQATSLLQSVAKGLEKVDITNLPEDDAPADLGATRLAFLEGQTSLLSAAPRELIEMQPNYEFDPMPPPENENIFTGEGIRLPWVESRQRSTAPSDIEARLRRMFERPANPDAHPDGMAEGEPIDLFQAEARAEEQAQLLDDQELQRDLEEHARRGNGPGLLGTLMQLLGGRQAEGGDGEPRQPDGAGDFPGAWPSDSDEDDFYVDR